MFLFVHLAILQEKAGSSSGIGVLTSMDRDAWADARAHLESIGNVEALNLIDSSLYVISLEDEHWHHTEEGVTDSVIEMVAGARPENRSGLPDGQKIH
jgi:hypothetical protein